jgi:hypothetical protein
MRAWSGAVQNHVVMRPRPTDGSREHGWSSDRRSEDTSPSRRQSTRGSGAAAKRLSSTRLCRAPHNPRFWMIASTPGWRSQPRGRREAPRARHEARVVVEHRVVAEQPGWSCRFRRVGIGHTSRATAPRRDRSASVGACKPSPTTPPRSRPASRCSRATVATETTRRESPAGDHVRRISGTDAVECSHGDLG